MLNPHPKTLDQISSSIHSLGTKDSNLITQRTKVASSFGTYFKVEFHEALSHSDQLLQRINHNLYE